MPEHQTPEPSRPDSDPVKLQLPTAVEGQSRSGKIGHNDCAPPPTRNNRRRYQLLLGGGLICVSCFALVVACRQNEKAELFRLTSENQELLTKELTCGGVAHGGDYLVVGGYDGNLRLWDLGSKTCVKVVTSHADGVLAVACSSRTDICASVGRNNTIRIWKVPTMEAVFSLNGHEGWITSALFNISGEQLITGGTDGTIRIWSIEEKREKRRIGTGLKAIVSLALSPDQSRLASVSEESLIRTFDVETGQQLTTYSGFVGWVTCVTFSPNGEWLLSGHTDGSVRLWNAKTGTQKSQFFGHTPWIESVQFSPNSDVYFSGGDGTIHCWCADVTAPIRLYSAYPGLVKGLVVHSADNILFSFGTDGTVRAWKIPTAK